MKENVLVEPQDEQLLIFRLYLSQFSIFLSEPETGNVLRAILQVTEYFCMCNSAPLKLHSRVRLLIADWFLTFVTNIGA